MLLHTPNLMFLRCEKNYFDMNINIFYYGQGALFDLIKLWKYLNSETGMLVIH